MSEVTLPGIGQIHLSRLICKDGTLMWRHALYSHGFLKLPTDQAVCAHIQKTAQRLEELSSWLPQDPDCGELISPIEWFNPTKAEHKDGISVRFEHTSLPSIDVFQALMGHIHPHESLMMLPQGLLFKRC